jgi:RimJ/RimL family protein N-acetyltransferase
MIVRPTLTTQRLVLRPYREEDAADVWRVAGDREIADTTLRIPHPYEERDAVAFIARQQDNFAAGRSVQFAMTSAVDGELLGGIGLTIDPDHSSAELGYYVAVPHWGKGYASEAATAVIAFAFEVKHLNRVHAHHMTRNPASGRILQKIGMRHEGTLREHIIKWGVPENVEVYAVLAADR